MCAEEASLQEQMNPREEDLRKVFRNLYDVGPVIFGYQGLDTMKRTLSEFDAVEEIPLERIKAKQEFLYKLDNLIEFRSNFETADFERRLAEFYSQSSALKIDVLGDAKGLMQRAAECKNTNAIFWTQGQVDDETGRIHSPFSNDNGYKATDPLPSQQDKLRRSEVYDFINAENKIKLATNLHPREDMVIGGVEKFSAFRELLLEFKNEKSGRRIIVVDDLLDNLAKIHDLRKEFPEIEIVLYHINRKGQRLSPEEAVSSLLSYSIEIESLDEITEIENALLVLDVDRTVIDTDKYKQDIEDLFVNKFT
ncbi:hypothetical protein KBD45_02245 [Candidatus Dojkabacteria bacterium]|nr:hypothetical protein [Candidatus Dojkabacteria bacterium]